MYEFGPEGTTFTKDVKVTFETEKSESSAVVYFTKKGSPTEFEKLPTTRSEKQVSAAVKHFSLGFVGAPEADAPSVGRDSGTGHDLDAGALLPEAAPIDLPDADSGPGSVPGAKRIRVISTDRYGRPADQTWAAYRDGDGAWQALTPTVEGDYQFDVHQDTYAVAFVCADADLASEGVVLLAPATRSTQQVEATYLCVTAIPAPYKVSGEISSSSSDFAWGHPFGEGRQPLTVGGPPATYEMPDFPAGVTVDPAVAVLDGNSFIMKANILRNLTLTEDQTLAIDLASQGYGAIDAQFSVSGATSDTDLTVHLATRNANKGLSLGWRGGFVSGTTTRTLQYQYLMNPTFLPADNYVFEAIEETSDTTRWARLRTKTNGDVSLEFPQPFSVSFARGGSSFLLPRMQFDSVPEAVHYRLTISDPEGLVRTFSVQADPAWLTLSQEADAGQQMPEHDLQLPDLTSAPGFNTSWLHPVQNTVYLTGAVRRSTNALGGVLESHSSRTEPSSIPL